MLLQEQGMTHGALVQTQSVLGHGKSESGQRQDVLRWGPGAPPLLATVKIHRGEKKG